MERHYGRGAFRRMNGAIPLVVWLKRGVADPFSAGDETSGADP